MTQRDRSKGRIAIPLPDPVQACVERVRKAGGEVLLVGGAVRDALQGRKTEDFDFATSLGPQQLMRLFPAARVDTTLGACSLQVEGHLVTLTTFREEGAYEDHRHPSHVRFLPSFEGDARRRDFTVNAIYVEPESGEILDPLGGERDLRRGVLEMIGDPDRRLAEDALRLLRAVRFAASAELEMSAQTRQALGRQVQELRHLKVELVFSELTRIFTGLGRGAALELLVETGIAGRVLPELAALAGVEQPPTYHPEGDVLTHTCLVLEHAGAGDPVLAWSAVLHDIGKPATFERAPDRIRFSGHDVLSTEMAGVVLRRLAAPRALRETVEEICRHHIRFASILEMGRAKRERWMRSPHFAAHLAFHRADCLGSHGDLSIHAAVTELLAGLAPEPPPPLCTGKDVLALGVAEGPLVGELLRLLQGDLEKRQNPDRTLALRLLGELVAPHVKR